MWIFVDQWDLISGMIMIHRWYESEPAGVHPWVGLLVPHPISRFIHLVIASIQREVVLPPKVHFIKHSHSQQSTTSLPETISKKTASKMIK